MEGFVIHALPVSEGILAIAPMPGCTGNYASDLRHIKDWKPALVVSMTTSTELSNMGAQTIGADLVDAGTRWVHLPIEDFGHPTSESEEIWYETSRAALSALQGGGRVLIHCKGGCGRSGMAALRLMIDRGENSHDALKRLRTLRPCAVETDAQLRWALRR